MNKIELAFKLMLESEKEILSSGAVDFDIVKKMENELNITLPPSYKEFLIKFGTLSFESIDIYGITKKMFAGDSVPCAIFSTQKARERGDINNKMIKIMSTGYGASFCIDTSEVDSNAESPIYEVPLMDINEKRFIAKSFGDFLLEVIQCEIEMK